MGKDMLLADMTTFHIGGPAGQFLQTEAEGEMVDAVRCADEGLNPLLVIGGGSNLLCSDEGFPGLVLRDGRKDVLDVRQCAGGEIVTAPGGMELDRLVMSTLDFGLCGLEAFSGIPGSVGAMPVQNVGAYGHEACEVIESVRVYDRALKRIEDRPYRSFHPAYRCSDLKRSTLKEGLVGAKAFNPTGRWVVLSVTFRLSRALQSRPVLYRELADALGVEVGGSVPPQRLREAVLMLRESKGMVYRKDDRDTWSAGSFFTNPIVTADTALQVPDSVPRYPACEDIKLSAAALIQQSGFYKGFSLNFSPARLSSKHVLAISNTGGAKAADVLELAMHIVSGVESAFHVRLSPEPVFVGIERWQ